MKENKTTELQLIHKSEPTAIQPQSTVLNQINIGDLLSKAIDAKTGVEVVERLRAMWLDQQARDAEAQFHEAMAAFQSECPVIDKTKFGAKNAYKYATLDVIVDNVRSLLKKHGFSYSITSEIEEKWVKAICRVTHRGGHSEESSFKVPIDNRNTMMNDPQRYAGSMTFAKRYAFCNSFGILTADEDRDGDTTKSKPSAPSSKAVVDISLKPLGVELWKLLSGQDDCREDDKDWTSRNQWLWNNEILDGGADEAAPYLTADKFRMIIAKTKEVLHVH